MIGRDKIKKVAEILFSNLTQKRIKFIVIGIEEITICPPNQIFPSKLLRIEVKTENRAAFIGQGQLSPIEGRKGFLSYYYQGFLEGYLHARYIPDFDDLPDILVDVKSSSGDLGNISRVLSYDEAIKEGYLHPFSMLSKKMKHYDLKLLSIVSDQVAGPSLPMILCIEKHSEYFLGKSVLDLFGGCGGLSVVSMCQGVRKSISVDLGPINQRESVDQSVNQYKEKILYEQRDVFSYTPNGKFHIALLDPFFHQSLRVASEIVPLLLRSGVETVILHISNAYEKAWVELVMEEFRKTFSDAVIEEYANSAILLGGNIVNG
jgi:16S rRNA G966 N2-methylase RsmD